MKVRVLLYSAVFMVQFAVLCLVTMTPKHPLTDFTENERIRYSASASDQTVKELRTPNCKKWQCGWRLYNESSPPYQSPFDIYEDETFSLPAEEWPLFCRPDNFGYTVEEALEVFPPGKYADCSSKFPRYTRSLHFINDTLVMNCTGVFRGKYLLGDWSRNGTILLPESFHAEVQLYQGPVPLQGEEWAIGTCEEDNDSLFEQVAIRVIADRELAEAQDRKTKIVKQESVKKFGNASPAKTIILLLTVDSASRRQFYRKLPHTAELLKNLSREKYHVTDFLIHNIIGDNSARNQVPLLTAEARLTNRSIKELEGTQEALYHGDGLGNRSLIKYAADRGFVTLLSFEFCHQYFATYIGDLPAVHHLVANFWCGAKKVAGFNFEKSVLGQRCIGPKMSHSYMMEYITKFTEAYFGLNQLIYTHITTGHEATGTQIETLDEDLVTFLQQYLQLADSGGYELSIILQGDHGMRYGEWYRNIAAFQEHRLPALFTVLPRIMMDRIESSYDVIEHNRKRLVGKLDLHITARSIVLSTFLPSLSRDNFIYQSWLSGDLAGSYSLLLTKVPNTRSCSDIYIPSFYCACMRMEAISNVTLSDPAMADLKSIIDAVLLASINQLNAASYTAISAPRGHVCRQLTIRQVNSIFAQRVSTRDEAFKVEFEVNEHSTARFESYTIVGASQKHLSARADQEGFLPEVGFFRGRRKRLRILFLKRLDSYSGFCEEVAFMHSITAQTCICQPASVLQQNIPATLAQVLRDITFTHSNATDCVTVCEAQGLNCDSQYFEPLEDPAFVEAELAASSCSRHDNLQKCVETAGQCSAQHSQWMEIACPCR